MKDVIYKLPLDPNTDSDLIDWINDIPRNKKAELVRHALRYYKSQLKEGEVFIMPSSSNRSAEDSAPVQRDVVRATKAEKKRPPAGLLTNITKPD